MNSRVTYSIVSKAITPEQAKKEFDYLAKNIRDNQFSAVAVTRETWNGSAWVLEERSDWENR